MVRCHGAHWPVVVHLLRGLCGSVRPCECCLFFFQGRKDWIGCWVGPRRALAPDGGVFVAEMFNHRVVHLAPWKSRTTAPASGRATPQRTRKTVTRTRGNVISRRSSAWLGVFFFETGKRIALVACGPSAGSSEHLVESSCWEAEGLALAGPMRIPTGSP